MAKIEEGTLIHGPLLGWAMVMGDDMVNFSTKNPDGSAGVPYKMPMRRGTPFQEYPWQTHGAQ